MQVIEKKPVSLLKDKVEDDPDIWHLVCICQRDRAVQRSVCGERLKGIWPTRKLGPEDICAMCTTVTVCPICKMPRQYRG
jgi:hypothetical protein